MSANAWIHRLPASCATSAACWRSAAAAVGSVDFVGETQRVESLGVRGRRSRRGGGGMRLARVLRAFRRCPRRWCRPPTACRACARPRGDPLRAEASMRSIHSEPCSFVASVEPGVAECPFGEALSNPRRALHRRRRRCSPSSIAPSRSPRTYRPYAATATATGNRSWPSGAGERDRGVGPARDLGVHAAKGVLA